MAESSVPGAVGERPDPMDVLRELDALRFTSTDADRATMAALREKARLVLSGGAVGEREEPLEQARDALLSVLTVCGLEGQDPSNTALAFQMIRDFARPAYDALVEAEKADD